MKKRFISLIALSAIIAPSLQSCGKKYKTKIYCDRKVTSSLPCMYYDAWNVQVSEDIKTAKSIQIIQVEASDGIKHYHYAVTWEE